MKAILIFVTLILTRPGQAIEVHSTTLKKLVEERNYDVAASQWEYDAAKDREGYLVRSFLPSIDVYGAQESFEIGSRLRRNQPIYGAEAKIRVFNGGQDKIEDNIRSLTADQRRFERQKILAFELEKARGVYWEIIYLQEREEILKNSIEVNKRNLAAANRRIRNGVATESDRYEFQMKDVDLRRELANAQMQLQNQARVLRVFIGMNEGDPLELKEKFTHDHDLSVITQHSESDHDFLFKDTELNADIGQLNARSKRRTWWPKVDAYAAFNKYNQRIESASPDIPLNMSDETAVGIRISSSLSGGTEAFHQAAAQDKEAEGQKLKAIRIKNQIDTAITNDSKELVLLHDLVHEAEENISRAEKYVQLTQTAYIRGIKNSPDVLGATEKLFAVQERRVRILRDFQIAKARILSKIGR